MRGSRFLCFVFLSFVSTSAFSSTAHGQGRPDDAREVFERGIEHAQRGEWQEALDSFQRSFDLSARPVTMMNLAGALERLGRLVEAAEAYRSFLSMARGGASTSLRDEAERQLDRLEERIPRVRLQLRSVLATDTVKLDAFEVTAGALRRPIPVDPGDHRVTVERESEELEVAFTASEGVAIEVVVDATHLGRRRVTQAPEEPEPTPPPERAGSIFGEPVFWTLIAVGAAATITGAVLGGLSLDAYAYVNNAVPNTRWTSLAQDYENAYTYSVVGWPLLGLGAATLIGAGVWALVYSPAPREQFRVQAGPLGVVSSYTF